MSEGEGGNRPIIIIKKKKGGHGHHGGAWKVAYADFVTAMMAFFLVMWLVAQSNKVKNAVAGYFKDPEAYAKNAGILPGGRGLNEGASPKSKAAAVDIETSVLEKAANKLKETFEQTKTFQGIKNQIEISVTKDGLEIQLLEKANQVLFDVGSTNPKDFTKSVLAEIGREIGHLSNKVIISGHTDRRPYHDDRVYSNWELSCERANAARRVMADNGVRGEQIARVAGFADTMLHSPEDPFAASNRRISILVLRGSSQAQAGSAEDSKGTDVSSSGEAQPADSPAKPAVPSSSESSK